MSELSVESQFMFHSTMQTFEKANESDKRELFSLILRQMLLQKSYLLEQMATNIWQKPLTESDIV